MFRQISAVRFVSKETGRTVLLPHIPHHQCSSTLHLRRTHPVRVAIAPVTYVLENNFSINVKIGFISLRCRPVCLLPILQVPSVYPGRLHRDAATVAYYRALYSICWHCFLQPTFVCFWGGLLANASSTTSVVPSSVDVHGWPLLRWPIALRVYLNFSVSLATVSYVMCLPYFLLKSVITLRHLHDPPIRRISIRSSFIFLHFVRKC